jgi:LacI family transcriptional regulator
LTPLLIQRRIVNDFKVLFQDNRMPKEKALYNGVTMKDVAAKAGVSTATISRVLSGKGGVTPDLEQRVRQAIQELGYYPHATARRLRKRDTRIVGVLVPDIQIPFFASIVVGIESILSEAGYLILLGNTLDELPNERKNINTFLAEYVSGVIFAPADASDTTHYEKLQRVGVPLVAIDRHPGKLEVDTVQIANVTAATRAVTHLIEEGYRRIALISGPESISTAVDRQIGYKKALIAAGIPYDPTLVQDGNYRTEGGYVAMRNLMEAAQPPTAVLSANNVMTLGALQYIHEKGIDIPNDLALISFDDIAWAPSLRPPLTVVAQPVYEIGKVSARLLLERIEDPQASIKHVTLETRLITRSSCGCGLVSTSRQGHQLSVHGL